jgi:hypothetical protein
MKPLSSIQADFDGIYFFLPSGTETKRDHQKSLDFIEENETTKKNLLKRARDGDEEAIKTLKEKYQIKRFVYRGKTIIE